MNKAATNTRNEDEPRTVRQRIGDSLKSGTGNLILFFIGEKGLPFVLSVVVLAYFKYFQQHSPGSASATIYWCIGIFFAAALYDFVQRKWVLAGNVGTAISAFWDVITSGLPVIALAIVVVLWLVGNVEISLFQLVPATGVLFVVYSDMMNIATKMLANRLADTYTPQK